MGRWPVLLATTWGFIEQLFGGQFGGFQQMQQHKVRWPKGVKNEILPDMAWLKGTEWHWNRWRNIKFQKDGTFEAPTQECVHMGLCEWAAYDGKVYIMWGDAGLHILEPTQKLKDQDLDSLKKTSLKGKRRSDGDPVKATFVKVFDFEAFLVEKDLYGILGVSEEADDGEIKRAYRRLSKELHPDKNPGDAAAAARFNDVRDAYEILNSKEQKILFDTGGMEAIHEYKKGQVQKGETREHTASVTLEMLYSGTSSPVQMSRRVVCIGCGRNPNQDKCRSCSRCPNEVRLVQRQMGPGFVVQQQEEVQSTEKCKNQQETMTLQVEKGMRDGDAITFEMMGEQKPKSIPGDVVFKLKAQKHKTFKRRGNDLTLKMNLSLRQALLGFEKTIRHLDGHEVKIRREGITSHGAVMTVKGEGMPLRDDPEEFGGLYIEFHVEFPDSLTQDQIEAIAKTMPEKHGDIVSSAGSARPEL
jgi:DnaJ-class molecular chaperone